MSEDNVIEKITSNKLPHYEPYGWHHWPEHPWLAYQFRRALYYDMKAGGVLQKTTMQGPQAAITFKF